VLGGLAIPIIITARPGKRLRKNGSDLSAINAIISPGYNGLWRL
jgi:hypothetical protein